MKKLYACYGSSRDSLIFQLLTDEEAYDVDMEGSWFGMIEVESEEEFHNRFAWDEGCKDFIEI